MSQTLRSHRIVEDPERNTPIVLEWTWVYTTTIYGALYPPRKKSWWKFWKKEKPRTKEEWLKDIRKEASKRGVCYTHNFIEYHFCPKENGDDSCTQKSKIRITTNQYNGWTAYRYEPFYSEHASSRKKLAEKLMNDAKLGYLSDSEIELPLLLLEY